jgi:hypothetical protein
MGDTSGTLTPEPVAAPEPVVEQPAAPAAPADPDDAALAALEAETIEVPVGDGSGKLVPLAAATTAREEAKRLRGEAKAAKEELDRLKGEFETAKALLQQQPPQAPPQPQGPTPEQITELEEVARDLEFYKTDGSLDLDRAGRHQARILKAAQAIARQEVAPYQQQTAMSQAQALYQEAASMKDPATGETADPQIIKGIWNQIAAQPGGMDTLTNRQAVAVLWGQAINQTRWKQAQSGGAPRPPAPNAAATPLPPPVFVEASGGAGTAPVMSAMERRLARDLGMSESEYLKAAEKAPRGA